MKLTLRSVHRDLGYFYLGLIIAFAFSGIFLNHRNDWYPSEYKYDAKEIQVVLPAEVSAIDDAFIAELTKKLGIEDKLKGFQIRRDNLRITFAETMVEINIKTGAGLQERYFKVPFLAQSTQLHVTTNTAWIWYSDIFGVAMLTIAITGMLMMKGDNSFSQRGWKLATLGIIFPLIFLFVIA